MTAARMCLTALLLSTLLSCLGVFLLPSTTALAATGSCSGQSVEANQAESCLFTTYVNPFIALLSALIGVVVVGSIIYGAIMYIQAGGDPGKVAAGKAKIINALIGLVAYLLLFVFLQFLLPGGAFNG